MLEVGGRGGAGAETGQLYVSHDHDHGTAQPSRAETKYRCNQFGWFTTPWRIKIKQLNEIAYAQLGDVDSFSMPEAASEHRVHA